MTTTKPSSVRIRSGSKWLRWLAVGSLFLLVWVFGGPITENRNASVPASQTDSFIPAAGHSTVGIPSACAFPSKAGAALDSERAFSLEEDIAPLRSIVDPFPSFNGIALDAANNRVVLSDSNRKSLVVYDRLSQSTPSEPAKPLGQVMGPNTQIGFVAGVTVDPLAREMYGVSNDIEDVMVAFPYEAQGNAQPRVLAVPHGAWGLSLSRTRNEIAVSVEHENAVYVYRRAAQNYDPPLRRILGPSTQMADPHGVFLDDVNEEIVIANHGNVNARRVANDELLGAGVRLGGRYVPASIAFYPATTDGDTKPLRVIQGNRTQLDWPMGIDVDVVHNEVAVANNGDHSVLVFRRSDTGNAEPARVISGLKTHIRAPMGVAIDTRNDEIWVANFGDHAAVVFDRTADGNVAPKRIIRSAPEGTPTGGFGNPMAAGYDSKRDEILVPN